MPELPEVETIIRKLQRGEPVERGLPAYPPPVGHVIVRAWTDWPRAAYPSGDAIKALSGHRVESIGRRGKYIVFTLSPCHLVTLSLNPTVSLSPCYLLIHLKMSGRLDVLKAETPRDKHVHFAFTLDNGYELRFNDARKFGRVYLVGDPAEVTGALGPEPLDDGFTLKSFRQRIAQKSGALKPLLLDQTFIAGIGNIYADEVLWRAKLHPLRRASSLSPVEVTALYRAIRAALAEGIRHEGTAIDWVYPEGNHQDFLRVYSRAGQSCRRCRTAIRRIVVGQRGTHFCPRCQPSPRSQKSSKKNRSPAPRPVKAKEDVRGQRRRGAL
jgi:formamidopyrimidine-DNA glycosylase